MDTPVTTDVTNRLLDRFAQAKNLRSDYAIAKALGCPTSTISNYRNRKTKMDATTAVQLADELQLPPIEVIAAVELEREITDRKREVWEKYRGRILLAASLALMPVWGQICAKVDHIEVTTYTLCAYLKRTRNSRPRRKEQSKLPSLRVRLE